MQDETPTNGVLGVKLDYVIKDMSIIKADLKEIKQDFITRREFETSNLEINEKIKFLNRSVWSVVGTVFTAVGIALLRLVIK